MFPVLTDDENFLVIVSRALRSACLLFRVGAEVCEPRGIAYTVKKEMSLLLMPVGKPHVTFKTTGVRSTTLTSSGGGGAGLSVVKLLGKANGLPVSSVLTACTVISYVVRGLRLVRVKFLRFLSRPRTNMYKGNIKKNGWLYLAVKDSIT